MAVPVSPTYADPRIDVALSEPNTVSLDLTNATVADRGLTWGHTGGAANEQFTLFSASFWKYTRVGNRVHVSFKLLVDDKNSATAGEATEIHITDPVFQALYNNSDFTGYVPYANYILSPDQTSTLVQDQSIPGMRKLANNKISLVWQRRKGSGDPGNPQGNLNMKVQEIAAGTTVDNAGRLEGSFTFLTTA